MAGKDGSWITSPLARVRALALFWSFRGLAILACVMALLSPGGLPEVDADSYGDFGSSALDPFLNSAGSLVAPPGRHPLANGDYGEMFLLQPYSYVYLLGHESGVYPVVVPGRLGERLPEVQRE